jgi:tetratricopeptide (TPR) repeat protein
MAKTVMKTALPQPAEVLESYRAAANAAPQDLQAQVDLGWGLYGASKYSEALEQFQRALALDPNSLDANYGLAISHKALGNKEAAVAAFAKVAELTAQVEDHVRGTMLRRLAHGHVNELNEGDWQLEAEIWHREE